MKTFVKEDTSRKAEVKDASLKKTSKRPKLPEHFCEKSALIACVFIAFSILLFIVPAYFAYIVWSEQLSLLVKIPTMIVLFTLSQQGLHLFGWIGHEGFHLTLFENKYVGAYIGIIVSSMVFSFMQIGASISHWNHHRYTNQELDPDVAIFTRFKTLLSRLLFVRITGNRIYLANAIKMAQGKELEYKYQLPFTKLEIKKLAVSNLLFSSLWTIVYLIVAIINPTMGIICIVFPHIFLTFYSSIRPYVEHAGTGDDLLTDSRSRISPVSTFFYFGNNYHLEHHLYPMVPCYKLPALHRYLKEIDFIKDSEALNIEKGIIGAYKFATGKFQYPDGNVKVKDFDPLQV